MTDARDQFDDLGPETTPLWSDQDVETLLSGKGAADSVLGNALGSLRTLVNEEPVPEPRADVLAMLEGMLTPPGRAKRRAVIVVATIGIGSVAVTGAAAASETVRDPLKAIVHKVVTTLDGSDASSPRVPATPPPGDSDPATAPTTPPASGSTDGAPTHQGAGAGAGAGAGHGTGHGQQAPKVGNHGTHHGQSGAGDPDPPAGQQPSQGHGHGQDRPPADGKSHGHAYGHDKDHGKSQGQDGSQGHGHAYGHDPDHGKGHQGDHGKGHQGDHGKGHGSGKPGHGKPPKP